MHLWTPAFMAAAQAEHWDVFCLDGDPTRPEIEFITDDPGPWASDDQVLVHCAVMAIFGGSVMHATALQLEASHNHGLAGLYGPHEAAA